jgi:hypothetical protein
VSGRRSKALRKTFKKLQETAVGVGADRYRSFKKAWVRRLPFYVPYGEAQLRGKK